MDSIFLSKKDNKILSLLKILLGACLLTPLLASSGVIFPYTVPKVFAFRILVEVAAVLYLYLILKYPKILCHSSCSSVIPVKTGIQAGQKDPGCRIKSGMRISVAVLIFLFFSLLSALFGSDFYASFWGDLERGGGVFSLLHFVVWFFMLSAVFRIDSFSPLWKRGVGGDFYQQLIKISVFTSTLISLLAIGQHFFGLGNLLPQVGRVYSFIGNAGLLAGYLIFNIFLAGYLAISSSVILSSVATGRRISFFLYSLFIILNSFALLLTGTRGAWLGLLAGIIVFLIILSIKSFNPLRLINRFFISLRSTQNDKKESSHSFVSLRTGSERSEGSERFIKKLSLFFLAIIFILIISLFLFRNSSFIKNNPTLSRLTEISLANATIQSRLILWQNTWQAWQEKPFLGFGPENFEMAVGPHLSPRLIDFEAYAFDRAHNFIFDYGVTVGWLGLLSYLSIFVIAFWLLIKSICHSERSASEEKNLKIDPSAWWPQDDRTCFLFSAIFLSLLTAYLVQNLFIFDSFVSYLMIFFVLACISNFVQSDCTINLTHSDCVRLEEKQSEKKSSQKSLSIVKKIIFIFVIGSLSFTIYSYNLKPFIAASYANQILSLPASEVKQITPLLKNVLALDSFASSEVVYQATLDYIDKISQNSALAQNEEFYNAASAELSKIIERSPSQVRNYIALSWLNLYFSGQEKTRIDQSLQLAQRVRELSPNKKDSYLLLVAGYSLSSQSQKAAQVVGQAMAVDGKMGEEVRGYYEKLK